MTKVIVIEKKEGAPTRMKNKTIEKVNEVKILLYETTPAKKSPGKIYLTYKTTWLSVKYYNI